VLPRFSYVIVLVFSLAASATLKVHDVYIKKCFSFSTAIMSPWPSFDRPSKSVSIAIMGPVLKNLQLVVDKAC